MPFTSTPRVVTQGLAWLVAATLLTAACKKEESVEVPSEPWVVLRSAPGYQTVAYLRSDLNTFEEIRLAGREICNHIGQKSCDVWIWSDFQLAQEVSQVDHYTTEMMDRRLAIYYLDEDSESLHLLCPEETIVIVADTPYCRSEYKYWPRAPSEDT